MASQITRPTIVYSAVYSGEDQRKHQSSVLLAFVQGIEFAAQMASNAENGSIWWRHHDDDPYGRDFFLTNVEKQKSYAVLKFVRISWYWMLNNQSVHINDIFKGYHRMALHQNQQYTNSKFVSTYSGAASLSNMWYIKAIQKAFQFANTVYNYLPWYL